MRTPDGGSLLKRLEHDLHAPVAFVILPVFAFANAGLSLSGIGLDELRDPVALGVTSGLLFGKPIGITLFAGLAVALRFAKLPPGVTWPRLVGVGFVCGIGFTMSLFIASLAFEHGSTDHFAGDRLGILVGSVLSALVGYMVLRATLPSTTDSAKEN